MKFGMEAEKFLFNQDTCEPSKRVFNFLHGLSDFEGYSSDATSPRITNEFVLNMVEFGTKPSTNPLAVLKDYLFHYLMMRKVALRENVALVPLASLPLNYLPHMISKWGYYVQNSVLAGQKLSGWMLDDHSPLKAAGNCAGVHVHAEIETRPEFLFAGRELVDKFNMGLMMTPLIAFSSSPYFFGKHQATSMRGLSYFYETYKDFPLNGGLPPVMQSSIDVLQFAKEGLDHWTKKALSLDFRPEEIHGLAKRGTNWNPVRWNSRWNTIEIRCLESDSIDLDCAKFLWITGAMKRMDLQGEALQCEPLKNKQKLDQQMINETFVISQKKVSILPSHAIKELFHRAVSFGLKDELVVAYLGRLEKFSRVSLNEKEKKVFSILGRVLKKHQSTSEWILSRTGSKPEIDNELAVKIINESIERQDAVLNALREEAPEIFSQLDKITPHI